MASPDPAKARILTHMNKDHQRELSHYLRYWAGLSSRAAATPELVDMTFTEMVIRTRDGTRHVVPIQPPLQSWADARIRAVDMDREARRQLGLSEIVVTEYTSAGPLKLSIVGLVLSAMTASWVLRSHITPGTMYYDKVLAFLPGGPERFLSLVSKVTPFVLAVHAVEASFLAKKLAKHDVIPFSTLWFKWIASDMIQGFETPLHLSQLVARKTQVLEEKKH